MLFHVDERVGAIGNQQVPAEYDFLIGEKTIRSPLVCAGVQ